MEIDVVRSGGHSTGGSLSNTGGSMTGPLILSRNPQTGLEAATKQYVDQALANLNASNFTSGTLPVARLPQLSGDVSNALGSNNITLSNTGVIAGAYSKIVVNDKGRATAGSSLDVNDIPNLDFGKINSGKPTTLSGYGITDAMTSAGGAMSGALNLHANPTSSDHLVTKQYVDGLIGSLSGAQTGDIIRKPYAETPVGFLKCNGGEVSKTTYSALYAIVGDQYTSNVKPGSGKPWQQQYEFNNDLSTDIGSWSAGTAIPGVLGNSAVFVTKNRVYLCGGYNGTSWLANVYTAPINSDGSLGSWTSGTALPGILGTSQAIVIKNKVYLLGGYNGSAYTGTVYYASINSDGTIGAWITGTSLPATVLYGSVVVTNSRIYLCGGNNGTATISTVYSAPINTDGSLGAWVTDGAMPGVLSHSSPVVTKNRVYVLAGSDGVVGAVTTVYTAPINSNGTLGTWATGTSIPTKVYSAQTLVTKNKVYIFGGYDGTAKTNVQIAPINADGTLGTWTAGTSLPIQYSYHQVIYTKNRISLIGGYSGGTYVSSVYYASVTGGLNDYSPYYTEDTTNYMTPGSGRPWQQQYQLNTTQTNDITGWTSDVSLPGVMGLGLSLVTKNRVYLIGGWNTAYSTTVYTAPINTDGSLGSWTTSTAIPGPFGQGSIVVTKNRVYLLAGRDNTSALSLSYTAPINTDGTLGSWATGTSLPGGLYGSHSLIIKNRVYLLGGYNGSSYVASVYVATIATDGTIGAWSTGNNLPASFSSGVVVVTKNRLYLCGGYGGSYLSSVYTCSVTSDGTLGTWTISTSLPGVIANAQLIATKNRVYIFGGFNGTTSVSTVYTAPINADGTLGTWVTGTSLPGGLCHSQAVITKNRVYLIGGLTGTTTYVSTIYTATINEGSNDYSPWYDGSVLPIEPTNPTTTFKLPDYTSLDTHGIYHYIKS